MEENIFQRVKKMISITDVVEKVLGEPDRTTGNEVYWYSQTHDEKTSSLGADVEKQIITDFSDTDFAEGSDMFRFLVQLNNYATSSKKGFIEEREINDYDALKWIVKEFNLDIDITTISTNSIQKHTKTITHYTLKQSDKVSNDLTDDIYAMFDTKEFTIKPKDNDVKGIKYRIKNNLEPTSYTLKMLKEDIIKGKTCIPAAISSKKDWTDNEDFYQVFMIDIDNVQVDGRISTLLLIK